MQTQFEPIPTSEADISATSPDLSVPHGAVVDQDPRLLELQRHNNPFDDFVHPSEFNRRLRAAHVDAVHGKAAAILEAAIGQYCLRREDIVPGGDGETLWSGVILIEGRRGEGKTHLLRNSLADANAVIVAPQDFETYRSFREYLLLQLIERLHGEPTHRSSMVAMADWFTRRLLVQAIQSVPELDWVSLCGHQSSGWFVNPLSRAMPRHWRHERQKLLAEIQSDAQVLQDVCGDGGCSSVFLRKLALSHLQRTEVTRTPTQQLRNRVYEELVETGFDHERVKIFDVLLSSPSSTEPDVESNSEVGAVAPPPLGRTVLVDEILKTLVQLFQMFGRPIVFAFDRLEALLGEPPDKRKCQAFHNGIAQTIDTAPGIPFLVFAEFGHWQDAAAHFNAYANQRFERGITVPGTGAVSSLKLSRIEMQGLRKIVSTRVRPLLTGIDDEFSTSLDDQDPELFPFKSTDLNAALNLDSGSQSTPTLRVVLQILRRRYDEIVFGRGKEPPDEFVKPPQHPDEIITDELQALWTRKLAESQRQVAQSPLLSTCDFLYNGLLHWLQNFRNEGCTLNGYSLNDVTIDTSFGNDLKYGECLVCIWKNKLQTVRHGVAFLLAGGSGMAVDLRTKVHMMETSKRVADGLTILWPRSVAVEPAHDALPNATSEVWQKFAKSKNGSRVKLFTTDYEFIACLNMIKDFNEEARERYPKEQPVIQHFICDQMKKFELIASPFIAET